MSLSTSIISVDQRLSLKWRAYLEYKGSLVKVDKTGVHRLPDDKSSKCEADKTTSYLFDEIERYWDRSGEDKKPVIKGELSRLLIQLFSAHCIDPEGALSTPRSQKNAVQLGLSHLRFKRILDALEKLEYIKTSRGNNLTHQTSRAIPTFKLIQRWIDDEWKPSKLIFKDRNKWLMVLKHPKKIVKFEREIEEKEARLYKTELRLQIKERELEKRERILAKKEGLRPSSIKKAIHRNLKEYKPQAIKDTWPSSEWERSKNENTSASMEYLKAFNKIYKKMDIKVAGRKFGIPPATIYRVFNNSCWTSGGRFYGHPVQQMSGEIRLNILIEDEPVVEIDFQSLHIAYAYQNVGIEVPNYENINDDLYSVIGHAGITGKGKLPTSGELLPSGKDALRAIKKKMFLVALNAETDLKAIGGACRDLRQDSKFNKLLPDDDGKLKGLLKQLLINIKEAHSGIANHLGSGKGLLFQYIDSQIMEKILRVFLLELGIPVIPIHDSILIPEKYRDLGIAVLKLAHLDFWNDCVNVTCDPVSPRKGVIEFGEGLSTKDIEFRQKALFAIRKVLLDDTLDYDTEKLAQATLLRIWSTEDWKDMIEKELYRDQ